MTHALFNIEGDSETHAVLDNGKVSVCGKAVWFPVGSSDQPSCEACRLELHKEPGANDVPCRTCGSVVHGKAECDAEGLVPDAYFGAWQEHTEPLPANPAGCAEWGHCGHVPCCNCSGQLPTAEITADVLSGRTCADPECDSSPYRGIRFCWRHAQP